jgi:hypothetical protein
MRYRRRIYRGKDKRQENRKWFIIGEMQVAGLQRAGNRRQDTGAVTRRHISRGFQLRIKLSVLFGL